MLKHILSLTNDNSTQPKVKTTGTSTSSTNSAPPPSPNPTPTSTANPALLSLLNQKNSSGNSPLHYAALTGNLEFVKSLVRAGVDVEAKNAANRDAVFEAENAGKEDVVAWLLGREEGDREDEVGRCEEGDGEERGGVVVDGEAGGGVRVADGGENNVVIAQPDFQTS